MDLSFRAAGLRPGVAGAESREILRPGETAPGAGIGRGARSRAGRVRVAGLLPVMIQGGKGFGFRLMTGGAPVISRAGGGAGGLRAGSLGPGVVLCKFGNRLCFRLITAGTVIMDGARSGTGGIFPTGLLPIMVQGRGGLLFDLSTTGTGVAGPAGRGTGGGGRRRSRYGWYQAGGWSPFWSRYSGCRCKGWTQRSDRRRGYGWSHPMRGPERLRVLIWSHYRRSRYN